MTDRPAILGGAPTSHEWIPIVRPLLPTFRDLVSEVEELISTGQLTKGKHLAEFERTLSEHLGVRNVVAVSSCTMGLFLCYKALGLTGNAVVPSFTFMATVSSLVLAGVEPTYADADLGTMNLDLERAEAVITPDTSAIVAVHNFGNPVDVERLTALTTRRGLKLVFDAAHGLGTLYRGRPLGAHGDASVFSLSPTKLVIAGEGGAVATNDDALAERIRLLREYGMISGYDTVQPGLNGRLPELSALLAVKSLAMLNAAVEHRNRVAEEYRAKLAGIPGIGFQSIRQEDRSSYKDFTITVDETGLGLTRDQLAAALKAENIDTRSYYSPPVHAQTAFRVFYRGEDLHNTVSLARRCLSLPMWSHMDSDTVHRVCSAIARIQAHAKELTKSLVGQAF
jgi:dTDP-4-amino-4,6-dideoxygalactose transaminase